MSKTPILLTAILVLLGAAGGTCAAFLHVPMPWLTGSLAVGAFISRVFPQLLGDGYTFPKNFRLCFIAIIGMTIGFQVHPDLLAKIPSLLASLVAITLFVPITQFGNYHLFRRFGGYDRPTAFFAGSPGGLMEALTLGETAGANVQLLTLQQFLRIIVVITLVPLGISLWIGHPVGSAAGLSNQMPTTDITQWINMPVLLVAGGIGLWAALRLRLPAGQLTGPLVAAAILNLLPLPAFAIPVWALVAAQVVIGVSLGVRFHNISTPVVVKGIWLAALSVAMMLTVGGVMSVILLQITTLRFDTLLISFAPGGVTEMGLIAISLAASPAVVAFHHVYRIVVTVLMMGYVARRMDRDGG